MFFSSMHAHDELNKYPQAIRRAIEYVASTDFSAVEDGRQEIDGEKMYANVFHLTSKLEEDTHPELHRKYIDVQFWIEGEELCGVAPAHGVGACIEENDEQDLYFYDGVQAESFIHALPGCYAVFFPNDAHRPGVAVDRKPSELRKVVVKVSVDLL